MQRENFINFFFLFFFFAYLFLILLFVGINFLVASDQLDPDFGWHLRTGQLILERGVPKVDWYSYTMSDFLWIDHSWLTNVLIYKIYSAFGFGVLFLVFLILSVLPFIILIEPKLFWFYLLPVIVGFLAILGFLGIRPQIITVLFVAIFWKILIGFFQDQKFSQRLIYFVPLLFIIWVNLHGGFFAGLFILFLILILEIFKKTIFFRKLISWPLFRQQNYKEQSTKKILILLAILVLSFLATLINPYGLRIYEEVFRTIGDPFLRFHIAEWLPLFFGGPFPVFIILYIGLFLGLLIPLRKKIEFSKLILVLVFFVFSLLNQRHFFIFVILSVPVFAEIVFYFKKEVKPEMVKILFSGFKKWIIVVFVLGTLGYGLYPALRDSFKKDKISFYPEKALPFLKTLPLSENLLNEYAWGGYLIWQLPERKVFIDGRMPSWRKDGQFVFGDYVKIMKVEPGFQDVLRKYNIKIMLLEKEDNKDNFKRELRAENRFANFLIRHNWLLKFSGLYPQKSLYQELVGLGWKTIYEDKTTVILRR